MFLQEKTHKMEMIEHRNEKELDVTLQIGVGKLTLTGDTSEVMDGRFIYRGEMVEPTIEYDVVDGKGELFINQGSVRSFGNFMSSKQEWDIALNPQLPLSLVLELGAGKSKLDLSNINLKSLNIDAGVGESFINLNGDWKESFDVKINTGVGTTHIQLPKEIGTRLKIDKGVGKLNADYFMVVGDYYQNQAYDASDVKIDIDLNVGIGEVTLEQR